MSLLGHYLSLKREEAKSLILSCGGKGRSASVSKNTDYVVAGADAGSKLDLAKKVGCKNHK